MLNRVSYSYTVMEESSRQTIETINNVKLSKDESMVDTNIAHQESKEEDSSPVKEGDNNYHAKMIQKNFKQRCNKFLKKEMQKMTFMDQVEYKDEQVLSEYSQAIFLNMKAQEGNFMVDPLYISKVQTEIRDTSRAFLLEWIIDVHRKFKLKPECLYVISMIIDQFLSRKKIFKQ